MNWYPVSDVLITAIITANYGLSALVLTNAIASARDQIEFDLNGLEFACRMRPKNGAANGIDFVHA